MTNDQQGKLLPFFARFLSVSEEESTTKSHDFSFASKADCEDY